MQLHLARELVQLRRRGVGKVVARVVLDAVDDDRAGRRDALGHKGEPRLRRLLRRRVLERQVGRAWLGLGFGLGLGLGLGLGVWGMG